MSIVYAGLLGLLTGAHAATWGAFKDSPFEGFRVTSFVRSIVLAVIGALVLAAATGLETRVSLLVFVGVLYSTERLITEWWKSFYREDDQAAYAIPMRVAVRGRPVEAHLPRYLTGLGLLVGLWLACRTAAAVQPEDSGPLWLLVLIGGLGGWLTAAGGAWKDAPVEGFSGWKFLRSPSVATAWTVLLLPFTHEWVALTVAAGGLSVASIETYKTFLTGGRPPGKFDGKPVLHCPGIVRDHCRALHFALYAILACAAGLVTLSGAEAHSPGRMLSLLVLTVGASNMALLVAVYRTALGYQMLPSAASHAACSGAARQHADALAKASRAGL